jgi:hypothetical protein
MFNTVESFYKKNDLGLLVLHFLNLHFTAKHQSHAVYFGGDRMLGLPVYESYFLSDEGESSPYRIFLETWKEKTGIQPLYISTFFRKTKLSECKKSPSWKQYKPHQDTEEFDIAGLIYFNTNCLKDGTYIFNNETDHEPTIIIGSRMNRCVWYNSQVWHSPTMEQSVDERWTQPFFIIYKEETYEIFLEKNKFKKPL